MSVARRIFEGQVPYRDFIWVRPIGPILLHVPVIAFGGDYTIILFRYVGIFQNCIAIWLLAEILRRKACPRIPASQFLLLLLIAQCQAVPMSIGYTRDAFFLCAIGIFIADGKNATRRCIGHFLIGAAWLAKQNFIFLIPASVLFFKSWKDKRLIISILLPGLLFALYLFANSAFGQAYQQITSLKGYFSHVALRALTSPYTVAGFATAFMLANVKNKQPIRIFAISLPCAIAAVTAVSVFMQNHLLAHDKTLFLFGCALGLVLAASLHARHERTVFMPYLCFLLFLGWVMTTSLSSSAVENLFALYVILPFMLMFSCNQEDRRKRKNLNLALAAVLILAVMPTYVHERLNLVYRTKIHTFLDVSMAGKFPGASGIVASATMANVYEQMNEMIEFARSRNKQYAILPEMPLYWAVSPQVNPLPSDWPYVIELGEAEALYNRMNLAADILRPNTLFIVQRFDLQRIIRDSPGLIGISKEIAAVEYPIVKHIESNYRLVAETDLFRVYE